MKITKVTRSFNENTFAPELHIEMALRVETLNDGALINEEEFATILGIEFLDQLKDKLNGQSKNA